jgi:hypothetical protein
MQQDNGRAAVAESFHVHRTGPHRDAEDVGVGGEMHRVKGRESAGRENVEGGEM